MEPETSDSLPPFDVSPEFIEEGRRENLVRPRQKFAPYTKAERQKRRMEVYRLHFEHGVPATRIAELMKVDRNTVNNDIRLLYGELGQEWGRIEFEDFHARQVARLESQRARLLTYLDKTDDVEKRLALERLVTDIDMKLLASSTKIYYSTVSFNDQLRKRMNETAKKEKREWGYTTLFELIKISQQTRRNIDGIVSQVKKDMIDNQGSKE